MGIQRELENARVFVCVFPSAFFFLICFSLWSRGGEDEKVASIQVASGPLYSCFI